MQVLLVRMRLYTTQLQSCKCSPDVPPGSKPRWLLRTLEWRRNNTLWDGRRSGKYGGGHKTLPLRQTPWNVNLPSCLTKHKYLPGHIFVFVFLAWTKPSFYFPNKDTFSQTRQSGKKRVLKVFATSNPKYLSLHKPWSQEHKSQWQAPWVLIYPESWEGEWVWSPHILDSCNLPWRIFTDNQLFSHWITQISIMTMPWVSKCILRWNYGKLCPVVCNELNICSLPTGTNGAVMADGHVHKQVNDLYSDLPWMLCAQDQGGRRGPRGSHNLLLIQRAALGPVAPWDHH